MSLGHSTSTLSARPPRRTQRQQGYTLIEILVAIFIGVFLLAGLFTILQNTRRTSSNQSGLAQLQDEERMAMSLLTDVIQNSGYFDPNSITAAGALPVVAGSSMVTTYALVAGQGLSGGSDGTNAIIVARFATNGSDGVMNCQGTTSTAETPYSNTFYIGSTTNAGKAISALYCSTDGSNTTGIPLVPYVTSMQVFYGISTTAGTNNVDTYMTASQVQGSSQGWSAVSSLRVTLGFQNPLSGQAGYTGTPTVYLTRVIPLQGRTGVIATAL
jgi:type IV pilus assembly protein PilW